ncbi:MAG: hypothetical protein ABIP81_07200 [Terriglobales bacterium]
MQRIRVHHQQELFGEPPAVPGVRLPPDVQLQLRQALAQWIRSLANTIGEEDDSDE